VIQGPGIEISSSEIRSRVAIGRPIRDLVPDEVEKYIDTKGLYRGIKERGS
jgi:nicotinate-nucleotide adenylyltransferase